ncbi:GNAT family N-acetyltransferase [Mucilaginibacter gilvus]|uniref:N-acetyltransferase n=1 Tax=Mucilaginibacter gilvus TaxID=2305909 RepID=A0A3S3V3R1_9SPHI|nr:GNAT family N-acetyltransferase [Mucilaginibacter gilvus]RWY57318.1 N-acetyltransferase [Mucilaginibacter gilvus]
MQFPLHKYGLVFRLVEESDAAFILSLRTDEGRAKHLSATDNNLQKQIDWIRNYKEREKAGIDYYVLFEDDKQQPLGVFRLYDIKDKSFTSGSWLIKPGCNEFVGLKSDLFIGFLAHEMLHLDDCFFDVRKNNKKVLRYHKRFAKLIGEDELNVYFVMDRAAYEQKSKFLTSIIQSDI